MKLDMEKLRRYVELEKLLCHPHPTLPLYSWSYSRTCQFAQDWDELTLLCRGLVTDEEGNVVALPFPKFFNWEENRHEGTSDFELYKKLDGTLGILFNYEGEWVFKTKKSFDSEYVYFFRDHFFENHSSSLPLLDENVTYLFELIHPNFRVVVDYEGMERIILIGAFDRISGNEIPMQDLQVGYQDHFHYVKRYEYLEGKDLSFLKGLNAENEEGFVLRFSNGQRCKIKFKDYVQLHSLFTNTSNQLVWEMAKEGREFDEATLDKIPDELYAWIEETRNELLHTFQSILQTHQIEYTRIRDLNLSSRKEFAQEVVRVSKKKNLYPWILFGMEDGNDYQNKLWLRLKPEFKLYAEARNQS